MKRRLVPILAIALWGLSMQWLAQYQSARGTTEYLSVPPAQTARALGAGFDNILADGLYVQFLTYFGRHMFKDRAYHNMAPMLELATDLDPHFDAAYMFGAMALGDNGQLAEAEALFEKGVRNNPDDWHYAYNAGMNLFLFGKSPDHFMRAAGYFKQAAALPGAPPEARFMEARMYDVTNRRDLLVAAWMSTYRDPPSKEARAVAARSLERLGVKLPDPAH